MRKFRDEWPVNGHLIKSSIRLTRPVKKRLSELLNTFSSKKYPNGMASKHLHCSTDWRMLRLGKKRRVLINVNVEPREVWVIKRRDLDLACKTIQARQHNYKGV